MFPRIEGLDVPLFIFLSELSRINFSRTLHKSFIYMHKQNEFQDQNICFKMIENKIILPKILPRPSQNKMIVILDTIITTKETTSSILYVQ